MRPDSHREQTPEKRCGNCRFRHEVKFKRDDLCFYGEEDKIEVNGKDWDGEWITFDGITLEIADWEDGYDKIWSKRIVDITDVCDHWREQESDDVDE